MAGWGNVFGKIAEYILSPAQRRRLKIAKLEERQKFISSNRRNDLADEYDRNKLELERLYKEAASV